MQTLRQPMAQNCQISTDHSTSAKGRAIPTPLAKPRWLGARTNPASDPIGCRFHISVELRIIRPLSNTFE